MLAGLVPLFSGCANSATGQSLQDSLTADPRLTETDPTTRPELSNPNDEGSTGTDSVGTDSAGTDSAVTDSAGTDSATSDRPAITDTPGEQAAGDRPARRDPTNPNSAAPDPGNSQNSGATIPGSAQAPAALDPYVQDWQALGGLALSDAERQSLQQSGVITRRIYARWLLAANNALYADQPGQQIRGAGQGSAPVFQDVPKGDRDFAAIQGLAEAGIIPSPLSGDSAAVQFQPDRPLTRETLLQWKVPLDYRQALAIATVDSIQKTWGFQDANKIAPAALRAILADHANGDLSNIRRAFGFTTLLQPQKPVTPAEAAAALWYFGTQGQGISVGDRLAAQDQP
jgi:hypothetical protein